MGRFFAGLHPRLDDTVQLYKGEGIVVFDIPKSFAWERNGHQICTIIEKFTYYGVPFQSLKYKGNTGFFPLPRPGLLQ